MERCEKCGKPLGEYLITAYGEKRCEDCWDDYLMTDRGKVEYYIGICRGDFPIVDYDADFLGHVAVCWKAFRNELALPIRDVVYLEERARILGII